MEKRYALLMLDNMKFNEYFVIAKPIGYVDCDEMEEQTDYTIYEDLITGNKIYPSNYEANEFIDPEEYEKQLGELKWIARKTINEKETLIKVRKIVEKDMLKYIDSINMSKKEKEKKYKKELIKHKKSLKKLNIKNV